MSTYRLVYCSRNTLAGSDAEIEAQIRAILALSRRNNRRDGITGALLFTAGCFAQALEGPAHAVEGAFERIQLDERHAEVTVLDADTAATRLFPDWSMAFSGAAGGLCALTLDRAFAAPAGASNAVLDLLRDVVRREEEWLTA
jgi:hypothetical protein